MATQLVRRASHAGNWYSGKASELNRQLEGWLANAPFSHGPARAVIVPHAGYSYSGPTAAFGFRQIDPQHVSRIFILGPSHQVPIDAGCALTRATHYETPLYNLQIDQQIKMRLELTGEFEYMSQETDENEHSIEMQLPYIAKIMENHRDQFTIIPILVGSLDPWAMEKYGKIFAPYLNDPSCVFVISSDFCHWGRRFGYTYIDDNKLEIYQAIEKLDRRGMDIIEEINAYKFQQYLKSYGNTICGRNPIGVLLCTLEKLGESGVALELKFLKYAQSSSCKHKEDSSVSYATASVCLARR